MQLLELLEQAVVRGALPGLVDLEAVGGLPRTGHQPHRHEDERRPQRFRPTLDRPDEGAEREVEVVGTGLVDDRLGLVGERAHPAQVGRARHVGVDGLLGGDQPRSCLCGQFAPVADAAGAQDVVELVGWQEVDGLARMEQVLDLAE